VQVVKSLDLDCMVHMHKKHDHIFTLKKKRVHLPPNCSYLLWQNTSTENLESCIGLKTWNELLTS